MRPEDPGCGPEVRRGRPPVLDERRIVNAALDVIDAGGFDALTVRALSARLGVSAAALYGHVDSKDALIDLVIDRLLTEVRIPGRGTPRQRVHQAATSIMRTLRSHPGLSQAILRHGAAGPHGVDLAERMLDLLRQAGTPDRRLWDAYHVILVYIHGHVLATTWPRDGSHQRRAAAARDRLRATPPRSLPAMTAASHHWRDDPSARFRLGLTALLQALCDPEEPG